MRKLWRCCDNKICKPDFVQRPKSIQTIEPDTSPFITIGGHTVNHPILPNCKDQEARFEIVHCKEVIEGWLGAEIDAFAYPNGSFGEREVEFCRDAGYKIAFANNPGFITQQNLKDKYRIPRVGFLEGASNAENICRMMGVWNRYTYKIF